MQVGDRIPHVGVTNKRHRERIVFVHTHFNQPRFARSRCVYDEAHSENKSADKLSWAVKGSRRRFWSKYNGIKRVYFCLLLFCRHVCDSARNHRRAMVPLMRWCSILSGTDIHGIATSLSVSADATRWCHWGDCSITLRSAVSPSTHVAFLLCCLCSNHRWYDGIERIRAADDRESAARRKGGGVLTIPARVNSAENTRSAFITRAVRTDLRTAFCSVYSSPGCLSLHMHGHTRS